jgi:hypothetical protein
MAFPLALMSMANGMLAGEGGNSQSNPMAMLTGKSGVTSLGKETLMAIASKNGVSPSFFESFKFLKFLDNSTGQWKSRFATMKNWTPDQRLTWYINEISNSDDPQNAIQYYELYGNHPERKVDDRTKVSLDLALAFNQLILGKFWNGNENGAVGRWEHRYYDVKIDVSKLQGGSKFSSVSAPTLANGMFSTDASGIDYENGNLQSSFMANPRPQNNASQTPQTLPSLNNPFDWKLIIAVLVSIAITVIAVRSKK